MTAGQETHIEIPLTERRKTRQNPPERAALAYRACEYSETLERMLGRLPLVTVRSPADGELSAPLARLNAHSGDDWTIGLLHAWAATTDVLSFYQERIVNEGFLRTAIERRSVVELVRTLGYEIRPGVAAGTHLAFNVVEDDETPDRTITIPPGTAVQSVPAGEELPQVFETSLPLTARTAWNRVPLTASTRAHRPDPSASISSGVESVDAATHGNRRRGLAEIDLAANSMRVVGADLGLLPDDRIFLIADEHDPPRDRRPPVERPEATTGERPARWETIVGVTTNADRGWTELTWTPADVDAEPRCVASDQPGVFHFKQSTTLFTYQPTGVDFHAHAAEAWSPAGIGLPAIPITALASLPNRTLLAACEEDIFRSVNGGASWQAFPTGAVPKKVRALAVSETGAAFAGTDDGDLFRSKDGREAWRMMSGGPPAPPPSATQRLLRAVPVPGKTLPRLPIAPVRSLAEYRDGKRTFLIAGTDEGVFRSADQGRTWRSAARFVARPPDPDAAAMPVTGAAVIKDPKRRDKPLVATPAGIFSLGRALPHRMIWMLAALVFAALQLAGIHVPDELGEQIAPLMAAFGIETDDAPDRDNPEEADRAADAAAGDSGGPDDSDPAGAAPAGSGADPRADDEAVDDGVADDDAATDGAAPGDNDGSDTDGGDDPLTGVLQGVLQRLPDWARVPLEQIGLEAVTAPLANLATVLAGVYAALFAAGRTRQAVQKRPGSSLGQPVQAVVVTGEGRLAVGTEEGIYLSREAGGQTTAAWWRKLGGFLLKTIAGDAARRWDQVLADTHIATLCLLPDEGIVAASPQGQTFRSTDDGATWERWDDLSHLADIHQLLATAEGVFAAGTPGDEGAEPRWSPWQLAAGALRLSTAAPPVEPGSWVTLTADDRPGELWIRQVRRVAREASQDLATPGPTTILYVDGLEPLQRWDRSRIAAWVGGVPLQPRIAQPVNGRFVRAMQRSAQLPLGSAVFVRGRRLRARVRQAQSTTTRLFVEGGEPVSLKRGEGLIVLAPPQDVAAMPPGPPTDRPGASSGREDSTAPDRAGSVAELAPELRLPVQTDRGLRGWVDVRQAMFESARLDDPVVSELRTVAGLHDVPEAAAAGATDIELATPLANCFDADTVELLGNVVPATHGETVPDEVLGSSDGQSVYQQYWLQQTGPEHRLTFTSAPTADGFEPALTVTVNGIAWHRVDALLDAQPDDRVFVLRQDDQGRASIAFGDGHESARIPSNREDIVARYRRGIGLAGNVPAGSLTTLNAPPAGVDEVVNPLAASGGVGPDTMAQARSRSALHVRDFGRLVSLADYETFAANFAGVGRACARLFHLADRAILHLSIATPGGQPLPADSPILAHLVDAIRATEAVPQRMIQVSSYQPRSLQISAHVLIHADWAEARQRLLAEARRSLGEHFSFVRRAFGQNVSVSEVISLLQSIDGVRAVRVTACYLQGAPPRRNELLRANLARLPAGRALSVKALPAELILFSLDEQDNLSIVWEVQE